MAAGTLPADLSQSELARMPLQAENCALIIVDIQEKLLPPIFERERLIRNSQLLIRLAGISGIPALVTTQYSKGLGQTVSDISTLLPDARSLDKVEFGCFNNQGFCSSVRSLPGQRNTMLLCGMESHICVMQTALGALNSGYIVHVASDAVSSRTEWNWKIGLERMKTAGAIISSTEMMIYELMRKSDSAGFKQMLQYLK
jgi:nicotinamidase-related amidase